MIGLAVVLALSVCGIGLGIGYAIHGTSTGSVAPAASSTTTSGPPHGGNGTTSSIMAHVSPELVTIEATFAYDSAKGAGTGMVVTPSGRVITNNHVIAGATAIQATDLGNGKTYTASVVGYDVADDVAVLQLDGASRLRTVGFTHSTPRLGDGVVAIGNAGGKGVPSAAAGVVTGLDQTITAFSEMSGTSEHLTGLIETNAAIESGQSGGPLVNSSSQVVGMVTASSTGYTFNQSASQGYAVPTATFRAVAASVVQGRSSASVHVGPTAFLGVRVTALQGTGAFVVQVLAASPAAAAGIVPGDTIVGLAGQAVRSPDTVSTVLAGYRPGAQLSATLVDQAGVQRTVTVTLVAGPPA